MDKRLLAATAALLIACMPPARAVDDAERNAVYGEFRGAFDAHRYAEALPIAQRLVKLTEQQYGADDRALVNPLSNLGTTQYRLKSYDAAQDAYRRGLAILDAKAAAADRQFIRPLHGLGASYFAVGRYEESVLVLKRAVDISRNLDGLFNPAQLELLRPLIASYDALHRFEDTAKEQQYAFTIAETSFGKNDPRLLGALDAYARWHESVGRYTQARVLHGQAVTLAEKIAGRGSPLAVDGLRGISRTYRLTYVYGEVQEQEATVTEGNTIPTIASHSIAPHPDGERALRAAAQILQAQKPVDARRLGETLVDLGDWYQITGSSDRAVSTWKGAWKLLEATGGTQLLATPAPLTYRAPSNAASRRAPDPEEYETHVVEVKFDVSRAGETANIIRSGGDAAEGQQKQVIAALRRTLYRPRFENGEPVDTKGFVATEVVLAKRKS